MTQDRIPGDHTFGFIIKVIEEGKFDRHKYWAEDGSMVVRMRNSEMNLHVTKHANGAYLVDAENYESSLASSALEQLGHTQNKSYNVQQLSELLRQVSRLYCNMHHEQPKQPFQEGVAARAHAPEGQTAPSTQAHRGGR